MEVPRTASDGNNWRNEDGDSESGQLIEKPDLESIQRNSKHRIHWSIWTITAFNLVVFAATVMLAIRAKGPSACPKLTDLEVIKKTHAYSPILEAMPVELHDVVLNGSFLNNPPSVYRFDPSPEVDGAWARLADVGRHLITGEDVIKLGKDPKTASRAPEKLLKAMGRENEGNLYHAEIDVFHQLHCLDIVRRQAYWDYYHMRNWGAIDDIHTPHWTHVSHCIDMLRQNIMCKADVEVITSTSTLIVRPEGPGRQDWPSPDFNLHKKCRNFEQLQEWQNQNRIPNDLLELLN